MTGGQERGAGRCASSDKPRDAPAGPPRSPVGSRPTTAPRDLRASRGLTVALLCSAPRSWRTGARDRDQAC